MNLENKVALVTGSSRGLGKVLSEQLLEKGCTVIGWSRKETPIDHPNFKGYCLDVGNEDLVKTAFQELIASFKKVDIIVNNAGFGAYEPIEETSSEVMRNMFETNVFGIFYLTKLAVPYMKAAKMGHIINISSIAGITGMENLSVYNATKFAVKGMSESLYKELRPHGIKLTCILPGSIQTDFFNDIEGLSPSGTMLQAAEVADSIVYCLESSNSFHPVNFEIRPFKTLV